MFRNTNERPYVDPSRLPTKGGKLCARPFYGGGNGVGVFLDPGLGKTLTTLTVADTLRGFGEVYKTLIVAPLRVVHNVWPQEIDRWGFNFKVSIVSSPVSKKRIEALNAERWKDPKQYVPGFDLLVVDESSKFKNWSAKRTPALCRLAEKIPNRLILTGSPAPNSMTDLFSQIRILDGGEALGKTKTYFNAHFCTKGGFRGREWIIDGDKAERGIEAAISPIVYRLSADDCLDLPPLLRNKVNVDLPPAVFKAYRQIERELFTLLDNGEKLTATNAAAKYILCQSIANGGAYKGDDFGNRDEIHVHDAKVDAVEEIIDELQGKAAIVVYQYNHDLHRLQKRFPKAPVIKGGLRQTDADRIFKDWDNKAIPVLLCQPQAMSHGLNMQKGGNDIIWLGLTDSLETYEQTNCRIFRQGVVGPVRVHHILANGTVDAVKYQRLKDKDQKQTALLKAFDDYRRADFE